MRAFVVPILSPEDGFLDLLDTLAGAGANLAAVSLLPGDPPRMGFAVIDEDRARRALRELRLVADEYELVELRLPNTPGTLAAAARELAAAGNPIQLQLTLRANRGRTTELIAVRDPAAARFVIRGLSEDGLLD